MHLESWLHYVINETLKSDAEYRQVANRDSLDILTRSDVETYQDYRLCQTLRRCLENSSFYRDLYRQVGIGEEEIRSRCDLTRLPLTEPRHLWESPFRFLCTSQANVARHYTFVTSGTTGPQKRIFWTLGDLNRIINFMAAGIGTVADAADTVLILLPDGRPYSQADLLCRGVARLGAKSVVANVDLDASTLLKTIEEFHCSVIFGYTRGLYRLSMDQQLQNSVRGKGVKVLFLAAEYLSNSMRKELQRIWDCDIRTHYGLTEMGLGVAVECDAQDGYHFNEADLLLEIVDPRTGQTVAPGEEGELVFTTLNREAMPLVRYRTHDLSRIIPEPCPCGVSSLLKIDKVRKRLEAITAVGSGDEMYPTLFDDVLYEIPGLVDYQVTIIRQNNMDRLDFKIEMAAEEACSVQEMRHRLMASPIIAKNMAAGKMVEPGIEFAGSGELQSLARSKKMIVDRR